MAARFFARGGSQLAIIGQNLTDLQIEHNRKIAIENNLLRSWVITPDDSPLQVEQKVKEIREWYDRNQQLYRFTTTPWQKMGIFFFETRFYRYMGKVLTLDFGTLRNDDNKTAPY